MRDKHDTTKASTVITTITALLERTRNAAANAAFVRPIVVVLLILGSFLAVSIGSPSTSDPISAASAAPIPRPTPDQEEINALLEQLKGLLAEAVEDEDKVNSIIEKWDQLILVRKRKKQIINLLFADVQSGLRNKQMADAVWASWSEVIAEADAEEPEPPSSGGNKPTGGQFVNGHYVLTDETRRNKGKSEIESFMKLVYQSSKVWSSPERRQYRGQSYTVYVSNEPADPDARDKIAGIDKAVKTVTDSGFALPYDLRFYCTGVQGVHNQGFKRGYNWEPIAYIALGPGAGSDALSTTAAGFNGFDTRTIRTIHEIGHIVHERQAGDAFWQTLLKANPLIATKVSGYATNGGEKEYVAEVFAGIMIGKRWPNDVLMEYRKFGGPMLAPF